MNPLNNTASYAGARTLSGNLQTTSPNAAQSSTFEEVWGPLKIQINSFNSIVSVHTLWYRNWDSGMKQSIIQAMAIGKSNVRFTQIANLPDRVFLGAVEDLHKAGVRRSPNCWILFRKSMQGPVREEYSGLGFGETSQKIREKWYALRDEERRYWENLAEEAKRQHARDNPNYKYQPRRPAEIKKRGGKARKSIQNATGSTARGADIDVGAPGNNDVGALDNGGVPGDVGATGADWVRGLVGDGMGVDTTFSVSDYQSFTSDCRGIY
ncbi:hypothetical protein DL770_008523 [Monosporascus sp. CRB-9-2]|nr:hypothetical protein DL770_008523 [Monosporascus sp. CRB-9-2]